MSTDELLGVIQQLIEESGGGGGETTSANVSLVDALQESLSGSAMNQKANNIELVAKLKEINPLIVVAEENQTINTYSVPKLTESDLTDIYNAQMDGRQVVILDATENYCYAPKQVDTDTDEIYVCFDFCDVMMLNYHTTPDGVETTYKTFSQKTDAIEVADATDESLSGTATTQAEVNAEFKTEIELQKIKVDVVDIVAVYDRGTDTSKTDIVHYDTSTIVANDIIKVLKDETHSNNLSYYKFNGTTFNYIGSEQSADVDNSTIDRNDLNQLEIKDEGITIDKINELLKAISISDSPTDNKFVTEKALYDYFASGNDGDARNISNVDLNTISNTGIYFCNVCTNRPVNANGTMVVGKISESTSYVAQLYLAFAEDEAWLRFKDNNTWKEWKRLAYISDLDSKQNITDNTLQTSSKTVPLAINEVNAIKTEIKEVSADITEALNKNYLYRVLKDNVSLIFTDAETGKQYKQVEYIATQETGTSPSVGQYIKTGVYFTEVDNRTGTEVRCKLSASEVPASGANKSIMGFLTNTSTTTHAMSLWVGNGGGSSYFGKIVNLHNSKLNVEQTIIWNSDGVVASYGDGTSETQVASTGTLRNGPFTKPLHIMWTGSNGQSRFAGKFYYLQFYKYGVLQQNYIPVIDIETNEYGMFETVSQKFYANDGTGAFTGGNIVTANKGFYMVENNTLVKVIRETDVPTMLNVLPNYKTTGTQTLKNTNGVLSWVDD